MPAEPIDEYSIKLNADVESLITTTQDAMDQIAEMMDDLVEKGKELGKIDAKELDEAFTKITEVFGATRESAAAAEEAVRKLEAAGVDGAAAYVVFADAIKDMQITTDEFSESLEFPEEGLELQAEKLAKINEGLQTMSQAWTDAGKAIPIERLDALENKLNKIFKEGIFTQRLSPDEVFKRMDEAVEESLGPLGRLKDKLNELDPKQITFIADEMRRAEQAFLDAGRAVPFEQLDRLEKQLIKIAQLAGSEQEGMVQGFERSAEATDKLLINLEGLIEKAEEMDKEFNLVEQGVAWTKIEENVRKVEKAYEDSGRAIPIEKLDQLRNKLENVFRIGLDQGVEFEGIWRRMAEVTNEMLPPLDKMGNKLFNIANSITRRFGVDLTGAMNKVNGLMRTGAQVASKFGVSLAGLTALLAGVAVGVLAVVAAIIIFVKWAKEGLALSLKDAEVQQRLGLAVRQHQRAMGDLALTQQRAIEFVKELGDTYNKTQIEMESLLATALTMTRQFKLGTEETLKLAEAAVILGESTGVSAESALRSITQFMLTGFTRGLQRIGIFLEEDALFTRALELKLVDLTGTMDKNAKTQAGLSLILEEAGKSQSDAALSAESYAKQILKAQDATKEAKKDLGGFFAPLKLFWEKINTIIIVGVIGGFVKVATWAHNVTGQVIALVDTLGQIQQQIKEAFDARDVKGFVEALGGANFTRILEENQKKQAEITKATIAEMHNRMRDVENLNDDTAESYQDLVNKITLAAGEIGRALKRMEQAAVTASARIKQTFADAKEKIDLDFGRRRADAAQDFNRDIADIDKEAQEDEIETTIDHQENLFKLEEDHKLKMQRLEENFLFDIEDAVRERDARGVLMAIRRFNQQKKEINQDKNLRTKRLKENFKKELQEIEVERRRRRAERLLEFGEESDDLALQEARRREDARLAFERAERDLEEANKRKVRILAEGFIEQFGVTNDSLNILFGLLDEYLGHGGFVEQLYEQIAIETAKVNLSPTFSTVDQVDASSGRGVFTNRARGGTLLATSPTMALFGEGGPERVDFTPLSAGTGLPKAGFEGGGGGGGSTDINLEVMLEEGLEAHLVDQTMDGVANVLINIGRKAKR